MIPSNSTIHTTVVYDAIVGIGVTQETSLCRNSLTLHEYVGTVLIEVIKLEVKLIPKSQLYTNIGLCRGFPCQIVNTYLALRISSTPIITRITKIIARSSSVNSGKISETATSDIIITDLTYRTFQLQKSQPISTVSHKLFLRNNPT